jgi:hypothetical protein
MWRSVAILSSVVFVSLIAPAAAGPLGETFVVDHLAADWVHRSGPGAPYWYLVEADVVTNVATGEVVASRARGGVGRCTGDAAHCGISPVREMRVVSYEADVLFQSAHLTVRGPNGVARVDFAASPFGSGPADSIHPCPGRSQAYADVARGARATGVAFGRRVSSATDWHRDSETMQREVYVCAEAG